MPAGFLLNYRQNFSETVPWRSQAFFPSFHIGSTVLVRAGVSMRRRDFITLGGVALVASGAARAQPGTPRRIGFLGNSNSELEAHLVGPFRKALHDLGYSEGRDIALEYRWAEGNYEKFPALVAEMIAANVEVIVTAGTPAAFAVKNASRSIPCVMVAVGDPVSTGLVESLARPGGNLTGLTSIAPDLEGKRLALLREMIPTLSSLALLWNPANAFHPGAVKAVQKAADALHIEVLSVGVRASEDLDEAFSAIEARRPGALVVLADRVFLHGRDRIMDFAGRQRLPGVYAYRELVESGGLMSYGPNYPEMHASAAKFVDKILRGAKPADLPIEQPIKFELVINIRTAKKLQIEVSQTLLATADDIIE
jgi:putative ABC transport system substrate-binding protein